MMIETLMFLATAIAQAPSAPDAASCGQTPSRAAPLVDPAIIEITYNAFVALEETPDVSDLARPAIASAPDEQSAFAVPGGTAWIS